MIFETGDVVLFRTKMSWNPMTWIAPAIRLFVGSTYNHSAVICNGRLVEADEYGVREKYIDKIYDKKFSAVKVLRRKDYKEVEKEVRKRVSDTLGVRYDFTSLFIYQVIFQITGVWVGKKEFRADNRFYCTEHSAYVHMDLFPKWWKADHKEFGKKMDVVWKR